LIARGGGCAPHARSISSAQEEHDMHNVMTAESVSIGEENNGMDPCEQAARATQRAASGFADGAGHARDAAAAASDQAVRAGVELMQRNAKTLQHALQCGARLAARLSERSTDQFGRAIGVSAEGAEDAAQRSSLNFEAIVQSGVVLSEITQRLCEEWVDVARARLDRGFDRFDAFLHCRTPQDFTALSSELMRDNMETLLGYVRRAGEQSARIAGEARQQTASGGSRQAAVMPGRVG
jgi:hypothetical protein